MTLPRPLVLWLFLPLLCSDAPGVTKPSVLPHPASSQSAKPHSSPAPHATAGRVFESFVPALSFSKLCASQIRLINLSETAVKVEVEAHEASGGLAPLKGHASHAWIEPGQALDYSLDLEGETDGAWVRVREYLPVEQARDELVRVAEVHSVSSRRSISIRATTSCLEGNAVIAKSREEAAPLRDPWFSGRVEELTGVTVWAVNVSSSPARVDACYSSGTYVVLPGDTPKLPRPAVICSHADQFLLAPGAALRIPVEREGSTELGIQVKGDAVLLQALRSETTGSHTFSVDSTIRFEGQP